MPQGFLNYGLVAAVLVWGAVVGMMAYRLDDSPWRSAFAALAVGSLVTVAGIFKIRKYVDGMSKHLSSRVSHEGNMGALFARGAPTMKRWSLDARS